MVRSKCQHRDMKAALYDFEEASIYSLQRPAEGARRLDSNHLHEYQFEFLGNLQNDTQCIAILGSMLTAKFLHCANDQ